MAGFRAIARLVRADHYRASETELMRLSEGPVGELDAMIAAAIATVESWKRRS